jgi:hypothetical protein
MAGKHKKQAKIKSKEKPNRPTGKSLVIERIFNDRWNATTQRVTKDLVTLKDIATAIRWYNDNLPSGYRILSDNNPANFFKDFFRNTASGNRNWPKSVLSRGYTAQQVTGSGNAFRFIPLPTDQVTAFAERDSRYPQNPGKECKFRIQSLSLDAKARLLGRTDETWLMQIAGKLRLIQSHLALCSELQFIEVSELQQGVKQSKSEIDGLFLGKVDRVRSMLITVEAKGRKDDILQIQVVQQVNAVMRMKSIQRNLESIAGDINDFYILPLAIKVIDESVVYVAEYEPVKYSKNGSIESVSLVRESLCQIMPPVEGI